MGRGNHAEVPREKTEGVEWRGQKQPSEKREQNNPAHSRSRDKGNENKNAGLKRG